MTASTIKLVEDVEGVINRDGSSPVRHCCPVFEDMVLDRAGVSGLFVYALAKRMTLYCDGEKQDVVKFAESLMSRKKRAKMRPPSSEEYPSMHRAPALFSASSPLHTHPFPPPFSPSSSSSSPPLVLSTSLVLRMLNLLHLPLSHRAHVTGRGATAAAEEYHLLPRAHV